MVIRSKKSAQTPKSKSKLKYELLNSNFGKKKNKFAPLSRLNIQMKKSRHPMTPNNKPPNSSKRNIDFVYEKSKRSVRQIYSNMKDYDSFTENPKNLMEIRKKLNLTAGYSDLVPSGKLRNYGTNTSNQSQNHVEKGIKQRNKINLDIKPSPGAFLKNSHRNKQIKIERQLEIQKNNYLDDNYLSKKRKNSNSKKRAKKDQLRKQLFNQNTTNSSRLGAQKINSVRGIKGKFLRMGDKYTSSRVIKNSKIQKYDNFQSYRAHGVKSHQKSLKEDRDKYEVEFKEGNLETKEAIERFADYIAEKGQLDDNQDSTEGIVKIGSISAQISPKLIKRKLNFFPSSKYLYIINSNVLEILPHLKSDEPKKRNISHYPRPTRPAISPISTRIQLKMMIGNRDQSSNSKVPRVGKTV